MAGIFDSILGQMRVAGQTAVQTLKDQLTAGQKQVEQAVIDGVLDATGVARMSLTSIPADLAAMTKAANSLRSWGFTLESLVKMQKGADQYAPQAQAWTVRAEQMRARLSAMQGEALRLSQLLAAKKDVPSAAARAYVTATAGLLKDADALTNDAVRIKDAINTRMQQIVAADTPTLKDYALAPISGAAPFIQQAGASIKAALPEVIQWPKYVALGLGAYALITLSGIMPKGRRR